jgi:hypothetical protein
MFEGEPLCVEERSLEAQNRTKVSGDPTPHAAIHGVANDGMSDGAQVDANLMGSSRVDGHLAQCDTWKMTSARDTRHRASRVLGAGGHLLPVRRVAADRGIDAAASLDNPPHKRDVFFLDFTVLKLTCQLLVGCVGLCDDHDARRATVEAMDDARARFASDTAEIRDVVKKRVDERSGRMAGAWVHDEPGRLVEHRHVGVLVDDFERERFAGNERRLYVRDIDRYAFPIAHRQVGPRVATLDPDVAVRNELLDE